MSVTEISADVFKRHLKSDELQTLLQEMESSKLVVLEKSATAGAPKTIVKFPRTSSEKSELSELRGEHRGLNSLFSLNSQGETEIRSLTEADFEGVTP
jgi:hypothetical protein